MTGVRDRADAGPVRIGLRSLGNLPERSLDLLVELEEAVHRASRHYDDEPWRLENFTRDLPGKLELSQVALAHGRPVGFLVASRRRAGVHVHRLAVDPDHWGDGVAAMLLARLLARSVGVVTVICDPRNEPARRLYAKAGFHPTGPTPAGRLSLSTDRLTPFAQLRVWYLFTSTGMHAGHAAHVPRLVEAMSRTMPTTAVRYGDPADLPSSRPTVAWVVAFARLVARARRERVDVIFVRIHWKLAAMLYVAGRIGGGWRVVLWSSGGPGVLPGAKLGRWQRADRYLQRLALRFAVDTVATGPPRVLRQAYAERFRLDPDRLLLASNDVAGDAWRGLAAAAAPELTAHPVVQRWLASPHRFLYVHSLDRMRGADRLPLLLAGIRAHLAGAQLLVLGEGQLRPRLAAEALLLAGKVPNEVAAWAMSQAHCLVVPSRQEGFPRVLVESMALGLPCVAFDVGGCSEVLGEARERYLARDGDVEEMVRLAVAAARVRATGGPRPELVERAAAFDTAPVADALAATLRSLRVQGVGAASWLSRSLWRSAFPVRRT